LADGRRELANLAEVGQLRVEPGTREEIESLLSSGSERLVDARRETLALSSRFDLGYNAAHALSLAALRWHGYRSENRYLVFQVVPHTLGLPATVWRVLAKAHQVRNAGEYEGRFEADASLVESLIKAADAVRTAVIALPPLKRR